MLPNPQYNPAALAQFPSYKAVARFILLELQFPERRVSNRALIVPWTSMPKTAVHKDCESGVGEDEVGIAQNTCVRAPALDSTISQEANERELRGFVSSTLYRCHSSRTLPRIEDIWHVLAKHRRNKLAEFHC